MSDPSSACRSCDLRADNPDLRGASRRSAVLGTLRQIGGYLRGHTKSQVTLRDE